MLGSQSIPTLVLVLIVYILIGLICDFIKEINSNTKEELPMKTKMKKVIIATIKSILNSAWTVGANLLAGALLT